VIIGVPKESYPGERRVALVPAVIPNLVKAGFEIAIEKGAGTDAGAGVAADSSSALGGVGAGVDTGAGTGIAADGGTALGGSGTSANSNC